MNLQRDFLSVETQKYVDFEQFQELFEIAFAALVDIYSPPVMTRLELRYQNHLPLDEGAAEEWEDFVVPALTEHLRFEHGGVLTQDSYTMRFDCGEIHVGFRYGVHNPDYPGPARDRRFILDVDCFIRDDIEMTDVPGKIEALNQEATDVFERSIGNSWRQRMRE